MERRPPLTDKDEKLRFKILGGIAAAVIFGYLIAVIFKPKEKK